MKYCELILMDCLVGLAVTSIQLGVVNLNIIAVNLCTGVCIGFSFEFLLVIYILSISKTLILIDII